MNQLSLRALSAFLALSACAKNGSSPSPEVAEDSSYAAEPLPAPMDTPPTPAVASPDPSALPPPETPGVPDAVSAPVGAVAAVPAPETAGMGKIQALSDAQIIKVTDVVNTGEIEQAKLARTKSRDPAVKSFASKMVSEHTKAKQEEESLATKGKIAPEESPTSADVATKVSSTLEALKAADRTDFDRAFVDAQVELHQATLTLLDERLLPSAADPQLRVQLERTRSTVQAHLSKARELQSMLVASATPP